ncbi:MAG: tryptophan-rich sensory protein [Solirubrobacterales bacterium]|nr:tryptophan-rich sensory protein [Solirubrobacterales bacterium]
MSTSENRLDVNPKRDVLAPGIIISAVAATAAFGGLATDPDSGWYKGLEKPAWQPPSLVFAPVWTVLYVLIAASMILVWRRSEGKGREKTFVLWGSNLALNLAWTFIFFRGHSPLAAGVEIIALEGTTIALIVRSWPISRVAALLIVPYALWVAFAAALTWTIALKN